MQDTRKSVFKVESHSIGPVFVSKPGKLETNYEKLGNAGIEGTSFQVDLLTVFLLNAIERTENWRLSTENKQGGKFDDVVFESPTGDVLLQAKHKQNERKVTLEHLLSTNTKHSDFSLPQYFFAYQSIKKNFHIQNVIICTNAKIQMDKHTRNLVAAQTLKTEHLLHFPGVSTICYTFNDHIKSELKENIERYFKESLRDKNIPAEIISDENIDDYIRHLQFVASYPYGRDIEKIMGNIISHLKLSQNLDGENCLKFIHKKIEDWYKEKKGRYLTRANGEAYFCEIRAKLFYEGFKRYGVYFENNDWPFSFKFLHIISQETYIFNVIKIFQALESANINGILFLNINEPTIFQKLAVEAFEIPQYTHLLILSAENRQIEITEEICDKIIEILNNCEYKKVILIGREDDYLSKKIKKTHFNFYHAVFDHVVFTDFAEETRGKFRQKTSIVFQGKNMCLNEMCVTDAQLNNLLCPKLLERIAKDEEIKIGSELLMKDIEKLYIPRSFTRNDYVFTEQEMCQLNGALPKVILISDFAGMGKSFVLTRLSVLLKKKYPHLCVIRIDLNMYTKYLRHCTKNLSTINILDLLNSVEATKLKNSFETELFSLDKRNVLMIDGIDEISPDYTDVIFQLLTDSNGNPIFKKIFVTTRPHLQQSVEEVLNVQSFNLKPFTRENQTDFITRCLETQVDMQDDVKKAKCKIYAECLVTRISLWLNEDKNKFAGIPLQTRMLAEVFQERALSSKDDLEDWESFKEFLTSGADVPKLPRKIDLVHLYRMFVARKREVCIYEKGNMNGSLLAEEGMKKIFDECHAYHCALALQVVLGKYRSNVFQLYTDRKYESDPEQNVLKIGIIQKVNENIQFIHRTFAEYFVAEAILVTLKSKYENKSFQKFFAIELLKRLQEPFLSRICDTQKPIEFNVRGRDDETALHKASKNGHSSVVQLLLEQGASADVADSFDFKPIHYAAQEGHLKVVELLTENGKGIDCTAVQKAAEKGHLKVVKYLIEKGFNLKEKLGYRSLDFAALNGHLNVVTYLIDMGVNVQETHECNLLNFAALNGHLNVVRYLIEKGVKVDKASGSQPLYFAAFNGHLNVVRYLIERKLNDREETECNLLNFAALNGQLNVVRYLIEKGVKVKDATGCNPLNFAALNGHLNTVRYLIEKEATIEETSEHNQLNFPAVIGHLNIVRYLIEKGVNAKEAPWYHPLNLAALNGHLNVVRYLIEKGVKIKETSMCNVLNFATLNGHLNVVSYLMEKGVNVKDLDIAAVNSRINVIKYLGKKGVNGQQDPACNVLNFIALNGHLNVVRYLIDKRVNVKKAPRCHPLNFAAFNGRLDVVRFLLDYGVDVNAKNSSGFTALHYAASGGHLNVVEFLIARGSDVNAANKQGATALHCTAETGALDVARALIENGADPSVKDAKGRTALHFAALNLPRPGKLEDGCASVNDSPNNCLELFKYLVKFENAYEQYAMIAASEKGL